MLAMTRPMTQSSMTMNGSDSLTPQAVTSGCAEDPTVTGDDRHAMHIAPVLLPNPYQPPRPTKGARYSLSLPHPPPSFPTPHGTTPPNPTPPSSDSFPIAKGGHHSSSSTSSGHEVWYG